MRSVSLGFIYCSGFLVSLTVLCVCVCAFFYIISINYDIRGFLCKLSPAAHSCCFFFLLLQSFAIAASSSCFLLFFSFLLCAQTEFTCANVIPIVVKQLCARNICKANRQMCMEFYMYGDICASRKSTVDCFWMKFLVCISWSNKAVDTSDCLWF